MLDFSDRRCSFRLKARLYFRAAAEGRRPEMIGKLNEISRRISENAQENSQEIKNIREDIANGVSGLVRTSNAMTYWGLKSRPQSFLMPAHMTPQ